MNTLTHEALGVEIVLPDVITLHLFRRYWQARAEHTVPPGEGGKANPADVYAELWHAALAIAEVTVNDAPAEAIDLDSVPLAVVRWVGTVVGQEVTAAAAIPKSADRDGSEGSDAGPVAGDRESGGAE